MNVRSTRDHEGSPRLHAGEPATSSAPLRLWTSREEPDDDRADLPRRIASGIAAAVMIAVTVAITAAAIAAAVHVGAAILSTQCVSVADELPPGSAHTRVCR